MRLLIDMNLTPRWAQELQAAGFEAEHWSNVGPGGAPDSELFEYARTHGCVLLTKHLELTGLLTHTATGKPSVVLLRGEPPLPEVQGAALIQALRDHAAELEAGAILTVDWTDRTRARPLPVA